VKGGVSEQESVANIGPTYMWTGGGIVESGAEIYQEEAGRFTRRE